MNQSSMSKEQFTKKCKFSEHLLLGNPRCGWVCFFMGTDLEKFSITSLAHQWILCSEWVPSEWCYCDVFISCLDSHSDGIHLLQRIHWWASDVMVNVSKKISHEQTNASTFSANLQFWVNYSFNAVDLFKQPLKCEKSAKTYPNHI